MSIEQTGEQTMIPPNLSQTQENSYRYALMLARMLMFAIEDFQSLGMEDWSLRLGEGVNDLMKKFDLNEADLRFKKNQSLN
jgi:hypothetical protein